MILRSNSNKKYILFYEYSHFCFFATVQSGHQKSPARTKVNLWKISLWKNKVNMIILITLVIQCGNSHLNLKSEDLWSNTFVETKTLHQKLRNLRTILNSTIVSIPYQHFANVVGMGQECYIGFHI